MKTENATQFSQALSKYYLYATPAGVYTNVNTILTT